MIAKRSVKWNYVMNIILTMSTLIFGVVSFFYISRVLSPTGVGKVAFATSVISYFLLFAQLGIPTYGIRLCAMVREDKQKLSRAVHEILFINLITTILTMGLLVIAVFCIPKLAADPSLYFIASITIVLNAIGTDWLYKALEEYTALMLRSVLFRILALIGIFALVKEQSDYRIYAGMLVLASSGYYVLNFLSLRKHISIRPVGKYDLKRHLKPIMVFFAMSCAITIYTNLDTAMLGFMKTDEETGLYQAATQVKSMLVSIVCSLGTVLLPRVASLVEQGKNKQFEHMAKKAIHFIIVVATPMVVFFMLFARAGIILLSGYTFEGAILPMQVIMPTLLLIGLTNIMGMQIMVPLGKEKRVFQSVLCGAIVDVILNAILIPGYGALGAAIGTLVAEFAVWLMQCIFLWKLVWPIYRSIHYGPILFGAALGSILGFWFQTLEYDGIYYYIKIAIAAVLYFILYFVTLRLFRNELVMEGIADVKKLLHRK